jgi:hypothetical protein
VAENLASRLQEFVAENLASAAARICGGKSCTGMVTAAWMSLASHRAESN